MNYTSDFFLYKGDEGDFKYLKSEEDMNTPKDEMITEAIHCMVEQRKHEIWEVLYPLSIKYGFTLDSDYASIKLELPCKDFPEEKCGCKLPLDSVGKCILSLIWKVVCGDCICQCTDLQG